MKPNNKVIVDKARLLRRAIVISWITLALCFVIKIFGGNFFEIMCENPNYKALCEYADSHLWCKYILAVCSSMICQCLYELAILQKYKFSKIEFLLTTVSVFATCLVKLYNSKVGIVLDFWVLLFLPIILIGKDYKKYWNALVGVIFNFSFQLISIVVKNLAIVVIDDSTFISLIYMIDIYIMCFLYYLYRNYKKEK